MLRLSATWLVLIFACNIKLFSAEEAPVRYDGAQLWRVYNMNNLTLINILEQKYGNIWADHTSYTEVAINKENLNAARQFLEANDIQIKVLITNIQHLIDEERLESLSLSAVSDWNSGMNWNKYHDLEVIYGFLEDINKKYPNITRLYTIGITSEGRQLKVLRISDDPENYKKIWIDGGIHAREWISPAAVTYMLDQLISNWQELPGYLKERTWYFMPVVNPDGYVFSRTTNRMWRKNRSKISSSECFGVDLNRNFLTGWEVLSSHDPCSDTYRGPEAGSELETKAITKFLLENKSNFKTYLAFHSFSQRFYYPYAYKNETVENDRELLNIGNKAAKRIKKETDMDYITGQVFKLAKLGGHGGGSLDWSYVELGAKYVYTMELRDQGEYGFLLPANQIIDTGKEALIFVKTLAEAIN